MTTQSSLEMEVLEGLKDKLDLLLLKHKYPVEQGAL